MTHDRLSEEYFENDYFEWLIDIVCKDRFAEQNSYRKLLAYLHSVEFMCLNKKDQDRACDGHDLQRRYALEYDLDSVPKYIDNPCSVLEMMIALALRCEETIMDDPKYGDRTAQWFWSMINSLGLGSMVDRLFNLDKAEKIVTIFLDREYEPDGRGGLFTIRGCDRDLRQVEIWTQLSWYLKKYYAN
jgi:hypothetical protein